MLVEQITGRRVRGFISGTDTHEDISCEVFYLEPDGEGATDDAVRSVDDAPPHAGV